MLEESLSYIYYLSIESNIAKSLSYAQVIKEYTTKNVGEIIIETLSDSWWTQMLSNHDIHTICQILSL